MRKKCPHGRRRYQCKECGGVSICPHGRQRNLCKECGGLIFALTVGSATYARSVVGQYLPSQPGAQYVQGVRRFEICPHGRQRIQCKECGRVEYLPSRPAAQCVFYLPPCGRL